MGGSESKLLAFRKAVVRLSDEKNISPAEQFWARFWVHPDSAEDVFNALTVSDIRRVIATAPENLATLMKKVTRRLIFLLKPSHPRLTRQELNQVLNCIRILTRILPVLYEPEHSAVEEFILWRVEEGAPASKEGSAADVRAASADREKGGVSERNGQHVNDTTAFEPQSSAPTPAGSETQALGRVVGEDLRDPHGVTDLQHSPAPGPAPSISTHHQFPLANQIVYAAVHCCFVEGLLFPVEEHDEGTAHHNFRLVIWAPGVGTESAPSGKGFEAARVEVVSFLLVVGSKIMYKSAGDVVSAVSPHFAPLLSRPLGPLLDKRVVLSLLCSLLNTVVSTASGNWLLPYDHLLFSDDSEEHLAGVCARTVVALSAEGVSGVDGPPPPSPAMSPADVKGKGKAKEDDDIPDTPRVASVPSAPGASSNSFRFYLGKLHRARDFDLLLGGIVRLLDTYVSASETSLPGSARRVNLCEELLLLLWTLFDTNARFLRHTLAHADFPRLFHAMLYLLLEAKDDAGRLGLARTCCFLVHAVSAEPELADAFKASGALKRLPKVGGAAGVVPQSMGDALVLSITHLILTAPVRLRTLDPMLEHLVLALYNVSPHLTDLSVLASEKLFQAFARLSEPAALLGGPMNWRACAWTLEICENIIRNSYQSNLRFVYSLCHNFRSIEALRALQFADAVESVRRRAAILSAKGGEHSPSSPAEQAAADPWEGREDSWKPSEQWWHSWHHSLPTSTLVVAHAHLAPQIEKVTAEDPLQQWPGVMEILKAASLDSVLPPASLITKRPFVFSAGVRVWFASYVWALVFAKSSGEGVAPVPKQPGIIPALAVTVATAGGGNRWTAPWHGTHVQLFQVQAAPS